MHDLKSIRKNPDYYIKKFSERNVNIDIKKLLDLDIENRKLIQSKEKYEQEKKIISQKVKDAVVDRFRDIFKKKKKIRNCNNFCICCFVNASGPDNSNWFGNTFVNSI